MFIWLNPSTADETTDDRTVGRRIGFAKYWGYSGMFMTNLFAYSATKPADMKRTAEPIGPDNEEFLIRLAGDAGVVVAAWGTDGAYRGRDKEVRALLPLLHYLRLTAAGFPAHPLYRPKNLRPILWIQGR
jgi:hypothetical protein